MQTPEPGTAAALPAADLSAELQRRSQLMLESIARLSAVYMQATQDALQAVTDPSRRPAPPPLTASAPTLAELAAQWQPLFEAMSLYGMRLCEAACTAQAELAALPEAAGELDAAPAAVVAAVPQAAPDPAVASAIASAARVEVPAAKSATAPRRQPNRKATPGAAA